jgi:GLPGLI family protein
LYYFKIYLFFHFYLFIAINSFSQRVYKVNYRHIVKQANVVYSGIIGNSAILIGNGTICNYVYSKQKNVNTSITQRNGIKIYDNIDDYYSDWDKSDLDKKPSPGIVRNYGTPDTIGNMVFYDRNSDSIFVREKKLTESLIISETLPSINWIITNEKKNIQNYLCTMAKAKFRGRSYEAWFTNDLPISDGPWKFKGLPGLILEISDTTGQVKIFAEKIEFPVLDSIPLFSMSGKKVNLSEFINYENKKIQKRNEYLDNLFRNRQGFDTLNIKPITKSPSLTFYGIETEM